MKIVVASGKGGTGKTTISVNMFLSLENSQLLDCDVEEPDSQHFLNLDLKDDGNVTSFSPIIDDDKCDLCGECVDLCHFNAIVVTPNKAMIFPELCHGCGLCALACPQGAISEKSKEVGRVQKGMDGRFYQGILNTGELLVPLLINAVKDKANNKEVVIIDAPPGNSCSAVAAVDDADFCILVTEPTPFGLHDLKYSIRMVNELGVPHAVVINRDGLGDDRVEKYCEEQGIPILMKIPNNREIAQLYSRGIPFVEEMPEWRERFKDLYRKSKEMVA